jgi:hypothetical protein
VSTGAQGPESRFEPFDASGVVNEWLSPQQVGGKGLTACDNIIYHRQGGWGKRPGVTRVNLPAGPDSNSKLVNGIRWYRTFPSTVTKLVVWQKGQLLIGNDPSSLSPIQVGDLSLVDNISPDFCSMRDPQASQGNGADVLIVAGLTLKNGGFAKGAITITGLPYSNTSETVYLTVTDGAQTVQTPTYYILPTDNPASIAAQLALLLNESAAFLNQGNPPFIGTSYSIEPIGVQTPNQPVTQQAILHLGARNGGAAGNNIQYSITLGGSLGTPPATGPNTPLGFLIGAGPLETPVGPPPATATQNFVGGGSDWSGPLRYDDGTNTLVGLSYMAPNPFTGCSTWHDHLWLWGDKNNPDTVFASDIDQPEAFTFMAENGGMTGSDNGGYNIGQGDGDPAVQACVPNGNSFYVWKTANIYAIQGYDFQVGEYSFSITPQIVGYGCPSRDCVDVLEGQYVFWSGRNFLRVAVGAYEPEHIGMPIPIHEGLAAAGQQRLVKVVAGDFQVQTAMTNRYIPMPGQPPTQTIMLRSVALFAIDGGDDVPDLVCVYDDEKTESIGAYAWSFFTGWNIGCWIKYGLGDLPSGRQDNPLLYFVDPGGTHIHLFGGDPVFDWGNPIPWSAQTGVIDFGTPELLKNIHEFYLRVQATANANFGVTVVPARIVPATPEQSQYTTTPSSFTFSPTLAPPACEALNNLKQFIQPAVQSQACLVMVSEDGTSGAGFELLSYGIDVNPQEAYGT